jgi:hypothetical protein
MGLGLLYMVLRMWVSGMFMGCRDNLLSSISGMIQMVTNKNGNMNNK